MNKLNNSNGITIPCKCIMGKQFLRRTLFCQNWSIEQIHEFSIIKYSIICENCLYDRIQTKVLYITRQFINQDTESMELLTKKIKQIQYKFLNQIFFPIMMMYILRIYYTVLRRQLKMIFLSVHLIFIVIICRFCLYLRIKD